MITLQHTLISLFANNGNEAQLDDEIIFILLPDAIRRYTGARQYSHFERSSTGREPSSWLTYPTNLKNLNEETVSKLPKYLSSGMIKCALGEKTDMNSFEEHNRHLPTFEYKGIKKHLIQDEIFGDFIRERIDCSNKYKDRFVYDGKEYDGIGIRKLLNDIENQGVYILAYMNYKAYGIITNQEWFDTHIKRKLDASYSQDLADGTYEYMRIPQDIDRMITEQDWSKLEEGVVSLDEYVRMYRQVAMEMIKIDLEKSKSTEDGPEEPGGR